MSPNDDYPIKTGVFVHTDGSSYTSAPTYDEIVTIVTFGSLLTFNDDVEVWIYRDRAAIVFNQLTGPTS